MFYISSWAGGGKMNKTLDQIYTIHHHHQVFPVWLQCSPVFFLFKPKFSLVISPRWEVSAPLCETQSSYWQLRNWGMWFSPLPGADFNKRKIVNILTDCLVLIERILPTAAYQKLEVDWHTRDYLRKLLPFTSKKSRVCKEATEFKVFTKLNLGI